jgi:hypothetical protein
MPWFLIVISVLMIFGRATVPGHDLSYAGSYEAFAHIWVGVLLTLSWQKNWRALSLLVLLTLYETMMFLNR